MVNYFICAISEVDWLVSREIGVYGNREGSERNGTVKYFAETKKGDETIQSIIEDLIGMKKGDCVFFHVIKSQERESSIHGAYRVREEPFYNDIKKLWSSNQNFVYPYRFGFEPHPEYDELCKYDTSILVSDFYRAIENRNIRSILTLEREVRGAAHAVKNITTEDANEIIRLLNRDFHLRHSKKEINFNPVQIDMEPLRNKIYRIGEIEFSIKALVAYQLGRRDPNLIKYLPACGSGNYNFLIESFIGQTSRKPTDILCINSDAQVKTVTIIEAKTDLAQIDVLIQSLQYLDLFKLRNIDKGSLNYKISICLLAQRYHKDLINYTAIRNLIMPSEKIFFLRYIPSEDGKDASIMPYPLPDPLMKLDVKYPEFNLQDYTSLVTSDPSRFYQLFGRTKIQKVTIEFKESKNNTKILEKFNMVNGEKSILSYIIIFEVNGDCSIDDFKNIMHIIQEEENKYKHRLINIEPIILAKNYDERLKFFIENYNSLETISGHQPLLVFTISK